jgi:nucleotide-binding universal stress UspA family protein
MRPIIQKIVVAEPLPWDKKANLARAQVVRQTAANLARLMKARLELCHAEALDPSYFMDQQILPLLKAEEERLAKLAKALGPKATASVKQGDPVAVLLDQARGRDVLLAMGTHGRKGMDRMVLGSVTEDVVRHALCPVMVFGPKAQAKAVKFAGRPRLLFATDLTEDSALAQGLAFGLAQNLKARLTILSFFAEKVPLPYPADAFGVLGAYPLPLDLKPMRQAKSIRLKHLAELAGRSGVEADYELEEKSSTAAQAILSKAKSHDLVVMGTHARGSLEVALLGGTAREVILGSPIPVITIRTQRKQ